ncbi:MAG: hypothetical protein QXL22_06375 [Candidatus Nezhaarchaeales archaeon]
MRKTIQAKVDLLKQIIYIVERSGSKEEALEKLARLLEDLEAEYNALLLEDPAVKRALKAQVPPRGGRREG